MRVEEESFGLWGIFQDQIERQIHVLGIEFYRSQSKGSRERGEEAGCLSLLSLLLFGQCPVTPC